MQSNGQILTTQLVSFLRSSDYKCKIDSISYHYGSGIAELVKSGDGGSYNGSFKDQPYAYI
jgi:hypothetical protein